MTRLFHILPVSTMIISLVFMLYLQFDVFTGKTDKNGFSEVGIIMPGIKFMNRTINDESMQQISLIPVEVNSVNSSNSVKIAQNNKKHIQFHFSTFPQENMCFIASPKESENGSIVYLPNLNVNYNNKVRRNLTDNHSQEVSPFINASELLRKAYISKRSITLSEIGSSYPVSLLSSKSTRSFIINSTNDDDPFEGGGGTDNPECYNDVPIGDGLLFLLLLGIAYVVFIAVRFRKVAVVKTKKLSIILRSKLF